MLELVVAVCTVVSNINGGSSELRCKEVHFNYHEESMTENQCMLGAQSQLAQWKSEDPKAEKWQIQRWWCQEAGQTANL